MSSDNFDIFNEKQLGTICDSRVLSLNRWSRTDAEAQLRAARFILGIFRDERQQSRTLLRSGPRRLDASFCRWLIRHRRKFALSSKAIANIRAVFEQNPGRAVHDLYLHRPDLQAEYPLALLPVGQKRFVQWLCSFGRQEAGLTDEQIIWFLHETASDLPIGVRETYLIRPDWQRRFPGLLVNRRQERRFLRWLHGQFPNWHALREVKHIRHVRLQQKRAFAWPSVFIREAAWLRMFWGQHAGAFLLSIRLTASRSDGPDCP